MSSPAIVFQTVSAKTSTPFLCRGERHFVLDWKRKPYVLKDYCRHRRGPLSLGIVDEKKGTITCPWHEMKSCISNLVPMALPAIRVGDRLSFGLIEEEP